MTLHDGALAYEGPATLITEDGTEHQADVALYVQTDGHLKQWLGNATLATTPVLGDGRLRMPDGREGAIILTNMTTGSDEVTLQGSGRPPFDWS